MRLKNLVVFVSFFVLAGFLCVLLSTRSWVMPFSYLILLDMVLGFLSAVLFVDYWRKIKRYRDYIGRYVSEPGRGEGRGRVAVVIPVYNEEPSMVAETAVSSQFITDKPGDVYVLDDSTDQDVRGELDAYSAEFGFSIVRRDSRKGYKAGAINNWLKTYGNKYDYVLVLDADQRVTPNSLEYLLRFFDDPDVSFVQAPQYYSELSNVLSASAYIQQVPFLRVTMKGRQMNNSAFSLGSGVVYRVKHLLEVGGLYEESVTEDVATSIIMHGRNLKSVYVDLPLIWHGEAPGNYKSYYVQQNRWALGTYQSLKLMLKEDIGVRRLLDYLNGFFYWLHIGPLAIADIIAPLMFLFLGVFFLRLNPLNYILVYIPIFLASLLVFFLIMRSYRYGIREFLLHQGIQLIASLPVTVAFFEWVLGRRVPFRRTPKGKQDRGFSPLYLFYVTVAMLLAASILAGAKELLLVKGSVKYAYVINMFWASWWLMVSLSSLYILTQRRIGKDMRVRISQSYEGFETQVLDMLICGSRLEGLIASYYTDIMKRYPEHKEKIAKLALDSEKHSRFYASLTSKLATKPKEPMSRCGWFEQVIRTSGLSEERGASLQSFLLLIEEVKMRIYAKLVKEVCNHLLSESEEKTIDVIINEELVHEDIIKTLRTKGR